MGATANLSRAGRALLGVIILGGVLLRLRYLGGPMRYDEAYTFDTYALSGIGHITSTYDLPNNHIFYSLLAHFSWQLVGDHVWTVRLPAFLAGIALIPMTYLVGRTLYDRRAGLCAAALTAAFGPLVEFSVNGRGYTLAALLMLVDVWLAAKLLRQTRLRLWAAFVACSVVGVYTVPTTAYGIAIVALWMTMCALRSPRQVRVVAELALACAVAAGLSLLLYSRVLGQPGWTAVTPVGVDWSSITNLVSTVWDSWNVDVPHPVDWILAASFITATALHRRIAQHAVPVAAAALVALAGIVAVGQLPPYSRNWLFLLPLYLIPAGAGMAWVAARVTAPRLPEGTVPLAATACVAVAIGLTTLSSGLRHSETPPTSDNDIVALLRRFVPPHQKAAVDPVFVRVPLSYYFRRFGGGELSSDTIGPAERRSGHVILVVARDVSPDAALRFFKATAAGPARRVFHNYIDIYDAPIAR